MYPRNVLLSLLAAIVIGPASASAAVYDVGPGQPYLSVGAVPWEALQGGDVVQIHWRAQPYNEKWVICIRGTAANPVVVRGVLGPNGERPVIEGNGATTRAQLTFWAGARGVIVVGGASVPADTLPSWITIENLDISSAHPSYGFTDSSGVPRTYSDAASAIYIEKGDHVTVRNCVLRNSANGFFVASSDALASSNITLETSYVYGNGIAGSVFQHNSYTAARGMLLQGNRFGALRSGANGNNIKDRSAGLVVRYNWVEGGNRELDLVEGEDSILIRQDPQYRATYVYGNVLIEPAGDGNPQIVHYGGDHPGMEADFRKGTLYFYNNTVITERTDRTTLFRLSTNGEAADARNNIFFATGLGSSVGLLDDTGNLVMRTNWLKPGFVPSLGGLTGVIDDNGSSILGLSPGFADLTTRDYRLTPTSPTRGAGSNLHPSTLPANDVSLEYVKHQMTRARARSGALDLGPFGFGITETAPAPPTNVRIIR
jgi:hypothetical protein